MRLDKLLAHSGFGTRKEVKQMIKDGYIEVNGKTELTPKTQVDPDQDIVLVGGQALHYEEFIYLMMNKPAGVISATEDILHETVIDLLEPVDIVQNPHPVGRLDIDTEGLLFLTNDGKLTHQLTSPNYKVDKIYYAEIEGIVDEDDINAFSIGLDLGDFIAMPALLKILSVNEELEVSEVEVTLQEGKFHQVKRMFEEVGKKVCYLKRIKMAGIPLDEALAPGEYRRLSEAELNILQKNHQIKG